MDDDDDAGKGRGGEVVNNGPAMGPVQVMWENSLEKLKILNYESSYCSGGKGKKALNRVHFVYPSPNASHQFEEFVDICIWLCTEITRDTNHFKRDQYDDPNTVANKLMLALRGLDFRLSFPPQKLKTAHGEQVCSVLDFLCDKALSARGFKWAAPVYAEGDTIEQGGGDNNDDNEEEGAVEDDALGEGEDDVLFEEIARPDIADASLDTSAHNILHAQIDPIEWKTELERVAPKLKALQTLSTNEWRAHVDQTITSKMHIEKLLGDNNSDLQSLNRTVLDEINRIKTKEKYVNHQFGAIITKYQEIKKAFEEFQKKSSRSSENVAKLTNDLAEITEKLDDLKESFDSKDSGMHDTSPLVRIKASLQQIKAEVGEFDLRIGVVSHSLLAAKVASSSHRRRGAALKAKQRHKGKHGKENHDENSLDYMDD